MAYHMAARPTSASALAECERNTSQETGPQLRNNISRWSADVWVRVRLRDPFSEQGFLIRGEGKIADRGQQRVSQLDSVRRAQPERLFQKHLVNHSVMVTAVTEAASRWPKTVAHVSSLS